MFEPRTYRTAAGAEDLIGFEAIVAETDLQILAEQNLAAQAESLIRALRTDLEHYIAAHPRFAESYVPVPIESGAPGIVAEMAHAAELAGVGPMAAVAGVIAEHVARGLRSFSAEVIVENGGDVYLCGEKDRVVGLWRGEGHEAGVGLAVAADSLPVAVATSSGRIGHSTSFGDADTVTVISVSGALADAVATATANRVRGEADIEPALAFARSIEGITGAVVSINGAIGAWGDVRLVPLGIE